MLCMRIETAQLYGRSFVCQVRPYSQAKVLYVCIFVYLSVKAAHLELVSDLTSQAFISALRRFTVRCEKPSLIWSDNGTNFVGAARELKEFLGFLKQQQAQKEISDFCSCQGVTWKFIPEHAPHFGGLWEAAVKNMKAHLRKTVGSVKLTFEDINTILAQIELADCSLLYPSTH